MSLTNYIVTAYTYSQSILSHYTHTYVASTHSQLIQRLTLRIKKALVKAHSCKLGHINILNIHIHSLRNMERRNRLVQYRIQYYLIGTSVIIRKNSSTLSLPAEKGSSGTLFVDQGVWDATNYKLPIRTNVVWQSDGKYISFYKENKPLEAIVNSDGYITKFK